MTRRALLAAAAVTLACGAARAGEVRGRLLLGDKPAAGMTVAALPYESPLDQARREARLAPAPQPIRVTTTGADGTFVLALTADPKKPTLFTVRVEGAGSVAAGLGGVWDPSDAEDVGEHVLVPGHPISGSVTDASGAPIADAEVVLIGRLDGLEDPDLEPSPRRARTGADGSFHIDGASTRGSALLIDKPGFLAARATLLAATTIVKPIVLRGGVPVSGVVRRTDRVSPAAGAFVRIEGDVTTRWVAASADGSFTIPNAPAGTITAVADAGEAGYAVLRGMTLPLAEGTTLGLVLQPPSVLAGRTVDANSGTAVPRARIEASAPGMTRTGRSGPDGSYALRDVPPGAWRVRVDERRYAPWTLDDVRVRTGETKKLDVPLVAGAALSGRVVDEDGQPVPLAEGRLSVRGAAARGRTAWLAAGREPPVFRSKPDGTFKAERLPPGTNRVLTVSHASLEPAVVGGLALPGGTTRAGVTVVLKRGAALTGTIRDVNAQPIAGAEVVLTPSPRAFGGVRFAGVPAGSGADRRAATTAPEGTFTLRGVAPGEYALTVKRSGYAIARVSQVKVPATGTPPPVEVTLSPGASITGRVTRRSGSGAEGFSVSARAPVVAGGAGAATDQPTGPDGAFSIEGLEPGQTYDLQLFGPAGTTAGKRGVMAPASDVVLAAPGAGRIAGVVRDAATGHPVPDFIVTYVPERGLGAFTAGRGGARGDPGSTAVGPMQPVTVHDDGGAFVLEDVLAGTWSVVVSAKGFQPGRAGGVVVEEGASRDNLEIRLLEGHVLKGRVVDAQTSAAIPNAMVSAGPSGMPQFVGALLTEASDGQVATDPEGRFELGGVATGTQTVRAVHPDYSDASQSVAVKDDAAVVEIRMTAGGVVGGMVASDTGQPVPGANVTLAEAGGGGFGGGGAPGAVTDDSGRFRFDHLGAGRYTVRATVGAQEATPQDVVLQPGDDQEGLVVRLQLGVTIRGTVSGVPSGSVGGVTVTASSAGSYPLSTQSGADGSFELDHVPVGIVMLRGTLSDPAGSTRTASQQVVTTADQPVATAQLVFDQGFTLSGRVSHAGGPAVGSSVFASLQGGGGRQASAIADEGGAYRLEGLQAGTYAVRATSADAVAPSSWSQDVAIASDQSLDITLPDGTITGRVVDAGSKSPVPTATVSVSPKDPSAAGGGRRTASTDSDGRFSMTGLGSASYTMTTSKADYQVDTREVSVGSSADTVVELGRATGIAITVRDGLAGIPLRNVIVCVEDPAGTAVFGPSSIALDDAGQGEIPALQPGTYRVVAGAFGYAAGHLDGVAVPSSALPISLTSGGTILVQAGPKTLGAGNGAGTITTVSGQPAVLSVFSRQGRLAVSQPNTKLRNLAPGSYVLSMPSVQFSGPVNVVEGGTAVIQLP